MPSRALFTLINKTLDGIPSCNGQRSISASPKPTNRALPTPNARHSSEAIQAEDTSKEQREGKDSERDQKKLKMNSLVLLGFALILVTLSGSEALSCMRCDPLNCSEPSNCKGGLVSDVCGCCDVCAQVLGEECGGPWDIYGKCDAGLECDADKDDFNAQGKCINMVS